MKNIRDFNSINTTSIQFFLKAIFISIIFTLAACESVSSIEPGKLDEENTLDPDASYVIISTANNWRYKKGTVAPANDWNTLGFDDSLWLIGKAGFGYGDADDTTVLNDMQGNYLTVYLRKSFTYDDSRNLNSLTLEVDYDDGFVAYLNGQEIARRNMPAGAPAFDTVATSREAGTAVVIDISSSSELINNGSNVFAIEVHNSSIGSSDLTIIPRLLMNTGNTGEPDPAPAPAPGPGETPPPVTGEALDSNPHPTDINGNSGDDSALISWSVPNKLEDNTAITIDKIAFYTIYHGTEPGVFNLPSTQISNTSTTQFTFTGLATGPHYFVITATDLNGNESTISNIVSKTVVN